ncbi:MAG: TIGR02680 family protein [Actinomycetota bacterium]|nr:TIGR02680 family protein [Actinomycetota bacterium]
MAGSDGQNRAGFAWVEFRRRPDEVFTIGARLRASATSRSVDPAYFTTSQVVGEDLRLLDPARVPLSRKELAEALGEHGQVHGSAEEHRSAVRERLFPGFSPDRFASVITALLALRKEKLSQNLDLAKLSDVLTDALPPIDERDLAVVAEGFERLDRRRDELARLEQDLVAVRTLARRQRAYARAVVAGVAGEVTSAEYRRDSVTRAEREAGDDLRLATAEDTHAADQIRGLESRVADIAVEVDARRTSKAYRKGADLHSLRTTARQAGDRAEADRRAVEARGREQQERSNEVEAARAEGVAATNQLERAVGDVQGVADDLGADQLTSEMGAAADPDAGEAFALAWITGRHEQTVRVREALAEHARAVDRRDAHETRVATDQVALDAALEQRRAAADDLGVTAARYSDEVVAWAGTCETVGPERVRAELGAPLYVPGVVIAAVNRLAQEIESAHAITIGDLGRQRDSAEAERSALSAERADLEAGHLPDPSPPPWRGDRQGRPGAPLWRLVEISATARGPQIDGLEAALGAAGLLDAWVSPDGAVDLGDSHDVVVTSRPLDGRTLAQMLDPLPDGPVPSAVIGAVLASVSVRSSAFVLDGQPDRGASDPEVIIGTDGSFRLGAAVGWAPVAPAALLGAAARERRRLQRLAQVAGAIAEVDAVLVRIERDQVARQREVEAARADLDASPNDDAIRNAERSVERTEARAALAAERTAQSRDRLAEAEQEVRSALRSLTTAAAQHGLPATAAELDRIDRALGQLEHRIRTWARRAHHLVVTDQILDRAEQGLVRAAELGVAAEATHTLSQRQAQDASVRLKTLEATAGVEYKAVLAEIQRLEEETGRADRSLRDLRNARLTLRERIGTLTTTLTKAEQDRIEADRAREASHRRLVAIVSEGLAAEAGVVPVAPLDGVTTTLAGARQIVNELDGVAADGTAVQRASSQVDDKLYEARAVLSGRADLSRDLGDHEWWILRGSLDGLRRPMGDLQATLDRTLEESQAELVAEEEQLFEQTLAGSVRRSLANRIRQANRLVERINDQLAEVRTAAAGVSVRLSWEVDPDQPAAVRSARALLLKDHTTDDERRALQDFVRARVDQARAELEHNAPWEARLRESLDYRAWHHFTLQISHQDWEGWRPATQRRLQRLSTGERSIALHLPMIASVAAHYADEHGQPSGCPRLILLDELFAGVDAANRAKLFGTFTAWDLDAVFTSDHEWCQYAALNGIAIHHLHPPVGDEPLTSTRFTWDGRRRTIDPPAA